MLRFASRCDTNLLSERGLRSIGCARRAEVGAWATWTPRLLENYPPGRARSQAHQNVLASPILPQQFERGRASPCESDAAEDGPSLMRTKRIETLYRATGISSRDSRARHWARSRTRSRRRGECTGPSCELALVVRKELLHRTIRAVKFGGLEVGTTRDAAFTPCEQPLEHFYRTAPCSVASTTWQPAEPAK
jgi:hypothetical protein